MSTFQSVTFREYLRIYFRHKTAMFLVFSIIMAALFFTILFKTPVYEAQVTLLITAQKKIEAYYYQDAGNAYGSGESTVALTQSEIMSSTPVLERAVKVLKLYKRPVDYERKFASPFKIKVQDQLKAFKHDLRELAKKPSVTVDDDFATAIRGAVEGLR
ncbi:MAG: hypothetical protein HGA76_07240, partial [Candidatus Firestonebacteria bacterium]|nr:hypothetical protein [Candidatus Firestonebacteria bacterium]